jgi:hypothetical protein
MNFPPLEIVSLTDRGTKITVLETREPDSIYGQEAKNREKVESGGKVGEEADLEKAEGDG